MVKRSRDNAESIIDAHESTSSPRTMLQSISARVCSRQGFIISSRRLASSATARAKPLPYTPKPQSPTAASEPAGKAKPTYNQLRRRFERHREMCEDTAEIYRWISIMVGSPIALVTSYYLYQRGKVFSLFKRACRINRYSHAWRRTETF